MVFCIKFFSTNLLSNFPIKLFFKDIALVCVHNVAPSFCFSYVQLPPPPITKGDLMFANRSDVLCGRSKSLYSSVAVKIPFDLINAVRNGVSVINLQLTIDLSHNIRLEKSWVK